MSKGKNRRLTRLEIWFRDNPKISDVITTILAILAVMVFVFVLKWDLDRTYVVHKDSSGEIVRIFDPKGRETDLTDDQLKKVTYEVVHVQ